MNKIIRLWVLAAAMMLCSFGTLTVLAEEAADPAAQGQTAAQESAQEVEVCPVQPEVSAPVAEPGEKLTGWQTSGKYKFYFTKNGKMVTGWKVIDKRTYYFRTVDEGKAPAGSMVTGFNTIGNKLFYFHKQGYLRKCGWIKISNKYYYLRTTGKLGTLGAAYTGGVKKVDGKYYYFKENGSVATGWQTVNDKRYYFSKSTKLGSRGSAATGWQTIGSYKYYFNSKGVMQTSKWIQNKYYVDASGHMLKKAVSPDKYYINSSGEKSTVAKGWKKIGSKYYYFNSKHKYVTGWKTISGKKYYFNSVGVRQKGWLTLNGAKYYLKSGVMQTGLVTIGGKKYYFAKNGKLYVNTTVDGYTIGEDGVVVENNEKASVLIIAGHGQGDVGAIGKYSSTTYYEYKLTREFATLIHAKMNAAGSNIAVTMYDQNYDCYQVLAGTKSGPDPNFTNYDYVLEVHFNATAESSKDTKGDGKYKGVGMYVNSAKKSTTIDKNIVASVAKATGFTVWGGGTGIMTSSGLLNARTCQAKGVSYGLLETAFIDDKDDITFYQKNKDAMAQAVASAIIAYFS